MSDLFKTKAERNAETVAGVIMFIMTIFASGVIGYLIGSHRKK